MPARALSAVALVLSLCIRPAHAQVLADLSPGTRVRVTSTLPELRGKVATVVAADSGRLAVAFWKGTRSDTVQIESTAVSTLEVSRGRRRDVAKGAGVGLLAGIASGAVLAAIGYTCDDRNAFCLEPSTGEVLVAGAVLGLGVGSLVSLVAPRERWERWPRAPERGLVPTIAPNPQGGVRVGLRLATPFLTR